MKGKEMNLEAMLDKMPEAKLKKLLKTPRWWNLAQPDHLTDKPRLVGLSEGDRRKLSSGDLGKNGRDAINAALDRKKGKRKPKIRELTTNELLALMPKAKADKVLKDIKTRTKHEPTRLGRHKPGSIKDELEQIERAFELHAHSLRSGQKDYDEEEIDARRKLANERKRAAKKKVKAKSAKKPTPYNLEAQRLKRAK